MQTIATIRRRLFAAALITLTALAAASTTKAATITWGAATTISGDSDVSTAGTLIAAYDVLFDAFTNTTILPPPPVVNGVTFNPFLVSGLTASKTVGAFTLTATTGTLFGHNTVGSGAAPFNNLSTDYKLLLSSLAGSFNNNTGHALATLSMTGLTVGNTYAFQFWVNASDHSYTDNIRATAGNSVILDVESGNATGGVGQFSIGTFFADNTSQAIVFDNLNPGDGAWLNAFQLRQTAAAPAVSAVPEPGSALVGLMVLGLCGTRLGRRRA